MIIDINVEDKVTRSITVFERKFDNELMTALSKLGRDSVNLYGMRIVPQYKGELRDSFEVTVSKTKTLKRAVITNTAPHAKFVEGPTKPHFVTFNKHPELEQWAKQKMGNINPDWYGLYVYKSKYPAHGGGQFMIKIHNWVEQNAEKYVQRAIDRTITKSRS